MQWVKEQKTDEIDENNKNDLFEKIYKSMMKYEPIWMNLMGFKDQYYDQYKYAFSKNVPRFD